MIADVAGVIASPIPAPNGTRPATIVQYDVPCARVDRTTRPTVISASPSTQVRSCPARAASRGAATRAHGIIASGIGSKLTAAISGLSPRTSCRYCSTRKMNPKNATNCIVIDSVPAENARMLNSLGSSIGAVRTLSQADEAGQRDHARCDAERGCGRWPSRRWVLR